MVTLAHQASVTRHVLETPLARALIADEVGLGKTVEAGLIAKALLDQRPNLRVLYLSPARLVRNVEREMRRLGLEFRRFAVQGNATLTDPLIVASIHRAVHPSHFDDVSESGPWDVVIVDECHHLSAWSSDGAGRTRQYALVERLLERLRPDGRVLLLSGTPHQGHEARFENLLRLLQRPGERPEDVRGCVIFRTKEDVTDWDGLPLFPLRQVNPASVVDLGPDYLQWLEDVRALYLGRPGEGSRASGWRAAQALQWAASSVHAGLGYLVRQAFRAGWRADDQVLRRALEALRPYRDGPPDEPVDRLAERVRREVQATSEVLEDIEDEPEEDDRWRPDRGQLTALLERGAELIATPAATRKWGSW